MQAVLVQMQEEEEGIDCRIGESFDDDGEREEMLCGGMMTSSLLLLQWLLNGQNDGGRCPL